MSRFNNKLFSKSQKSLSKDFVENPTEYDPFYIENIIESNSDKLIHVRYVSDYETITSSSSIKSYEECCTWKSSGGELQPSSSPDIPVGCCDLITVEQYNEVVTALNERLCALGFVHLFSTVSDFSQILISEVALMQQKVIDICHTFVVPSYTYDGQPCQTNIWSGDIIERVEILSTFFRRRDLNCSVLTGIAQNGDFLCDLLYEDLRDAISQLQWSAQSIKSRDQSWKYSVIDLTSDTWENIIDQETDSTYWLSSLNNSGDGDWWRPYTDMIPYNEHSNVPPNNFNAPSYWPWHKGYPISSENSSPSVNDPAFQVNYNYNCIQVSIFIYGNLLFQTRIKSKLCIDIPSDYKYDSVQIIAPISYETQSKWAFPILNTQSTPSSVFEWLPVNIDGVLYGKWLPYDCEIIQVGGGNSGSGFDTTTECDTVALNLLYTFPGSDGEETTLITPYLGEINQSPLISAKITKNEISGDLTCEKYPSLRTELKKGEIEGNHGWGWSFGNGNSANLPENNGSSSAGESDDHFDLPQQRIIGVIKWVFNTYPYTESMNRSIKNIIKQRQIDSQNIISKLNQNKHPLIKECKSCTQKITDDELYGREKYLNQINEQE